MNLNSHPPRGRFAPTPSGEMHIGNAWTALLAWLQIRSVSGNFILRMEDIDRPRSNPHLSRQIVDDLYWLGLDWDEGPDIGGPYGPYTQSERLEYYEEALQVIQAKDRLYSCFCSRSDLLSAARAPHGLASEGPAYPGTCRMLTSEERSLKAKNKQPSLRFLVEAESIYFHDGIAGDQLFDSSRNGDFIVKRADGIIAYQLAVVIDDEMMNITNVLRGADLLDSTPRQIQIYHALGLTPPTYAHVPLFIGTDGKRLAKRNRDTSLAAIRSRGIPPEQLVGWLAWIGGLQSSLEPVAPKELIHLYNIGKIPTKPVVITERLLAQLYS